MTDLFVMLLDRGRAPKVEATEFCPWLVSTVFTVFHV